MYTFSTYEQMDKKSDKYVNRAFRQSIWMLSLAFAFWKVWMCSLNVALWLSVWLLLLSLAMFAFQQVWLRSLAMVAIQRFALDSLWQSRQSLLLAAFAAVRQTSLKEGIGAMVCTRSVLHSVDLDLLVIQCVISQLIRRMKKAEKIMCG